MGFENDGVTYASCPEGSDLTGARVIRAKAVEVEETCSKVLGAGLLGSGVTRAGVGVAGVNGAGVTGALLGYNDGTKD